MLLGRGNRPHVDTCQAQVRQGRAGAGAWAQGKLQGCAVVTKEQGRRGHQGQLPAQCAVSHKAREEPAGSLTRGDSAKMLLQGHGLAAFDRQGLAPTLGPPLYQARLCGGALAVCCSKHTGSCTQGWLRCAPVAPLPFCTGVHMGWPACKGLTRRCAQARTLVHAHIHIHMHTCMNTHLRTEMHAHTHMHMHMHTPTQQHRSPCTHLWLIQAPLRRTRGPGGFVCAALQATLASPCAFLRLRGANPAAGTAP